MAADLPPANLEELAGAMGNSAMAELIAARTAEPELHPFSLEDIQGGEPEPFEAGVDPPALTEPPDIATGFEPMHAASPGAFTYGGVM